MTASCIFSRFATCVSGLGQGTRLATRRRAILERAAAFCGGGRAVETIGWSSMGIVGIGFWVRLARCWGGKPPLPLLIFR